MHHRFLFILLPAALLFSLSAAAVEYQHSLTAKDLTFQWALEGQSLHIKLTAKTTGWVAVGFNATHAMKDATFFIARIKEGVAKVSQNYGTSAYDHSKGEGEPEITNISGREENGSTEVSFTVPVTFKDPKYKPIPTDKAIDVLLAYSADDSTSAKHRFRTAVKVNLATGPAK